MRQELANLRRQKNLSQEKVAKMIGISRSFYGLIEIGRRNPTYGLAKKIAEILETNIEDVFLDYEGFRMKPLKPTGTD